MKERITPEMWEKALAASRARRATEAEAREKRLKELQAVPCLMCGTPVGKDPAPEWADKSITKVPIDGGAVDELIGGYGSCHDNTIYVVALCDPCLTAARDAGRAVDVGGYL